MFRKGPTDAVDGFKSLAQTTGDLKRGEEGSDVAVAPSLLKLALTKRPQKGAAVLSAKTDRLSGRSSD